MEPLSKKKLMILVLGLALVAAPVLATCNAVGCFNETVKMYKVSTDGKIWFVTDNSSTLSNLNTAGICVLKSIWTGAAEPALYIPVDDPDRDQKFAALMAAHATGAVIGFNFVEDPANGWCALGNISVD